MPVSLIHSLGRLPIAFLDVETTGASATWGDRVTEIGIVRYENGVRVSEYQRLVDPKRRISAGVVALTGITQDMVDGEPTFADRLWDIWSMLQGAVLVGHNVSFDLGFLRSEFKRAGADLRTSLLNPPVLDTVRIARKRFGRGGNSLGKLAAKLGIEQTAAHRALADAVTTAGVFEKMIEPVGGWTCMLCDAIVQQGGPMKIEPASSSKSALPLELEEALETGCLVRMEYLDAGRHRTQRLIKPLEIRRYNGEMILIAHCQLRNDRRNFKIDRIVSMMRAEIDSVQLSIEWTSSS